MPQPYKEIAIFAYCAIELNDKICKSITPNESKLLELSSMSSEELQSFTNTVDVESETKEMDMLKISMNDIKIDKDELESLIQIDSQYQLIMSGSNHEKEILDKQISLASLTTISVFCGYNQQLKNCTDIHNLIKLAVSEHKKQGIDIVIYQTIKRNYICKFHSNFQTLIQSIQYN